MGNRGVWGGRSEVAAFSTRASAFVSLEGTTGHEYIDRYGISAGIRREF